MALSKETRRCTTEWDVRMPLNDDFTGVRRKKEKPQRAKHNSESFGGKKSQSPTSIKQDKRKWSIQLKYGIGKRHIMRSSFHFFGKNRLIAGNSVALQSPKEREDIRIHNETST